MLKPKNPEVDEWKVVNMKIKGKKKNFKPTFDALLSKYVNQKTESRDRSSKVSAAPSLKHDRSHSHRSGYTSIVIKIGSIDETINDQVGNKILDHDLATRVWPPSICCRGSVLLTYLILKRGVAATSKSREQREGAETIEGGQQRNEVPVRPLPSIKKE
jgi:hypothetical protein